MLNHYIGFEVRRFNLVRGVGVLLRETPTSRRIGQNGGVVYHCPEHCVFWFDDDGNLRREPSPAKEPK